jgi:hypothetical protein
MWCWEWWYDNDDCTLYFFVFIKRAYTRLRATKIEHNNNDDDDDDCSPIFEKWVFSLLKILCRNLSFDEANW